MNRGRQPRIRRVVAGALFAALSLAVASTAGPFPQPARGRPPVVAMQAPQRDEIQLFDAAVSRVRVDVIVTDASGDFVPDLTADDFTVYEDGVRQKILDVQLVDIAAGEIHPLMGAATAPNETPPDGAETATPEGAGAPPAGTAAAGAVAAEARPPSPASELGAVIFLIDGPSLSPQTRARFGDAWEELLQQADKLPAPRAAYMIDNVGRLQELAPLGDDVERMRAAAQAVREAPFFGNMTRQRLIELANNLSDPGLGEGGRRIAAAKARSWEGQERSRSLATYELLTSFADALSQRSGRTAVVWVSTGIKLMQGGPYDTLLNAGPSGPSMDTFSPDPAIHAAQEALHRAANGSNVSLYTVDPSLLTESRLVGGDVEVGTIPGEVAGVEVGTTPEEVAWLLAAPEIQQSLDGLRDAMRTAAAETGGEAFIHATDLGMVLEKIEADTSRFYLLTYAPPAPDGDGEWHEIRVEVARDDTDVRARGGYVDHPPAERARRRIAAALALPGSVTGLPVEAQAFRSRVAPGAPNVLLAVAVDASELGVMLTPQGQRRVSLDVHAVALRDHEVVSESHQQLTASATGDGTFGADAVGSLTRTLAGYLTHKREWELEPGAYTLNVAVLDGVTGRIGATSLELEVPEESDTWGISDPLLVTLDDAGQVNPVVSGRLVPGQSIAVFVEVYDGARPILSGQVLVEQDDGQGRQQGAKLFPLALRPVAAGVHRGSAPLPPGLPPGRYVVQLAITDPPLQQHRIVRLPVEVVAPPGR